MEYMKIAIVTNDRAYGEALGRSLLIGNRNFDLSMFDCGCFIQRWQEGEMDFRKGFDLILWDSDEIGEIYGDNIVWLTERESDARRLEDNSQKRFAISKYSPSGEMVAAIFHIYSALTGRKPAGMRPDRVDVFAFASWQGGCGCTTLAMAAGQELTRFYRRRVLYLSIEGIDSAPLYMTGKAGMKTAAEYLYHLTSDSEDGAPFLEEYLVRDSYGMAAFAPGGSYNPLHTAGREEIRRLMPALMDSGRFDIILVDAGNGTGEAVREALSYADRICLVSTRQEQARETGYMSFLRYGIGDGAKGGANVGTKGIEEKLIRVRNRCGRPGGFSRSDAFEVATRSGTPGGSSASNDSGRSGPLGAGLFNLPVKPGSSTASEETDVSADSVCIAERDTAGLPLLLEGTFGKDIHKLTELCYNGVATANAVS